MPSGPLEGLVVVELGGIGPGPFAAMVLADLGADVVRVDRAVVGERLDHEDAEHDLLLRGRRSIGVDLKQPAGVEVVRRLATGADALIDPFRPGVTERLGLGPDDLAALNPRLVYGRVTGWGQDGPLAAAAGHDINYIALAGPLAAMGRGGAPPSPPLNLVGDYGGGGMLLVVGILAALQERARSGRGQVVDAAMVDGAALLATAIVGMGHMGIWGDEREANLLDGGAHFYDTYETADGGFVSLGPIEPRFYAQLLEKLGLDPAAWPQDRAAWPRLKVELARVMRTRSRSEWCALLEGTDVCFAPVLTFDEAATHPHLVARGTYVDAFGAVQPAPAPRFDRTPGAIGGPPCRPGEHTADVLAGLGLDPREIAQLQETGAVAAPAVNGTKS